MDVDGNKVTYESLDPTVATVDAYGKVISLKPGVVKIDVKAESFGMMTQSATITLGVE